MVTLISNAIASVRSFFKAIQAQTVLVVMLSFLLLTSNAVPNHNEALGKAVRDRVHQTDQADRPKTTGEWNREARETDGKPRERLSRIAKESGEAFKQFGSGYVDGAKETAQDLQEGAARGGRVFAN